VLVHTKTPLVCGNSFRFDYGHPVEIEISQLDAGSVFQSLKFEFLVFEGIENGKRSPFPIGRQRYRSFNTLGSGLDTYVVQDVKDQS
jgi:hypothetical protein